MARKVIYEVGISLDGFIARPDGTFDFLKSDPSYDLVAFFKTVDVVLMGRMTYEVMRKIGMNGYPGMKNYVFSRTQPAGEQHGVEFTKESPAKIIKKLKQKKGKHIYLCGGSTLARDIFRAGLVDEVSLGIIPVLIGQGIPVFLGPFPDTKLKLTKCMQYKNGMVNLIYSVKHKRK